MNEKFQTATMSSLLRTFDELFVNLVQTYGTST